MMHRIRPQLCNATPEEPPPSLASGARVPVAHTPDGTDVRVGTWFYWAPGCSGVTWPLGRPLIALNAIDAAIRLQRLDDGDQRHSDDARRAAAVRRLAALVLRHDGGMGSAALKLIGRIQGRNSTAAVVEFVERASRLRPCTLRGRLAPVDALALAVAGGSALAQLWHSHNEALLLRHGYDTLVLLQQPHNQASGAWATEIWDVRHGRAVFASARAMEASRLLRTLDGGSCHLKPQPQSDAWEQCIVPCEAGRDTHPCHEVHNSFS